MKLPREAPVNRRLSDAIQRLGFRKWYERELLSSHAHLVLALLSVVAMLASLEAFSGPVLAIIGGRFKGGDFADLSPALEAHGKAVFAIGESRHRVRDALSAVVPVFDCGSLEEAVELAWEEAERGDTVLLAPACSSFDMFKDYADRGDSFKRIVLDLVERNK